jgi:nucleoside 2-deoxyribosyltransferase
MTIIVNREPIQIYCASPFHRAAMWTNGSVVPPGVEIVSTWHNHPHGADEPALTSIDFAQHWLTDIREVKQAHLLLAYAELKDRPQGTLIEIGAAIGQGKPVILVGTYPWSNWSYHPLVHTFATFREAFDSIGVTTSDTSKN